MFNKYNLAKMLNRDWFIEVGKTHLEEDDLVQMPDEVTLDNKIADSLYEPNSFFGFDSIELHKENEGYYIRHIWQEPIGDYGTHQYVQWYKSINNEEINKCLKENNI